MTVWVAEKVIVFLDAIHADHAQQASFNKGMQGVIDGGFGKRDDFREQGGINLICGGVTWMRVHVLQHTDALIRRAQTFGDQFCFKGLFVIGYCVYFLILE